MLMPESQPKWLRDRVYKNNLAKAEKDSSYGRAMVRAHIEQNSRSAPGDLFKWLLHWLKDRGELAGCGEREAILNGLLGVPMKGHEKGWTEIFALGGPGEILDLRDMEQVLEGFTEYCWEPWRVGILNQMAMAAEQFPLELRIKALNGFCKWVGTAALLNLLKDADPGLGACIAERVGFERVDPERLVVLARSLSPEPKQRLAMLKYLSELEPRCPGFRPGDFLDDEVAAIRELAAILVMDEGGPALGARLPGFLGPEWPAAVHRVALRVLGPPVDLPGVQQRTQLLTSPDPRVKDLARQQLQAAEAISDMAKAVQGLASPWAVIERIIGKAEGLPVAGTADQARVDLVAVLARELASGATGEAGPYLWDIVQCQGFPSGLRAGALDSLPDADLEAGLPWLVDLVQASHPGRIRRPDPLVVAAVGRMVPIAPPEAQPLLLELAGNPYFNEPLAAGLVRLPWARASEVFQALRGARAADVWLRASLCHPDRQEQASILHPSTASTFGEEMVDRQVLAFWPGNADPFLAKVQLNKLVGNQGNRMTVKRIAAVLTAAGHLGILDPAWPRLKDIGRIKLGLAECDPAFRQRWGEAAVVPPEAPPPAEGPDPVAGAAGPGPEPPQAVPPPADPVSPPEAAQPAVPAPTPAGSGSAPPPKGNAKPKTQRASTRSFQRDPEVVAWVLAEAKGICELCRAEGPFRNADGVAFLEVHHPRWLSHLGTDEPSNAVALCPNCHRLLHHASRSEKKSALERLRQQVPRLV
jgi:hypothetical protein